MHKWERALALTVLANAVIGMAATMVDIASSPAMVGMLWFSLVVAAIGTAAGVSMVRGRLAGFVGGVLTGASQIVSYFPYNGVWSFNVRPGISLCLTTYWPSGVILVNAVAAVTVTASIAIVAERIISAYAAKSEPRHRV